MTTRALYLARTTTGGDARDGDATARMVERRDEVEGDGLGARAFSRIGREEARAMARRARGEWGDEEARRAASAAVDDAVTREREAREARGCGRRRDA